MTLTDQQAVALQEALDAAARFVAALDLDDGDDRRPDWLADFERGYQRPIPLTVAGGWCENFASPARVIVAAIGARLVAGDAADHDDAQLEPEPPPRPRRASTLPPSRSARR